MPDQLSSDLASLSIQRDDAPKRRTPLRLALALALLTGVAGASVLAYPRVMGAVFKTEIATTEILLVSPAQASIMVTSTGYVVPRVIARPGAKAPGRLAAVRIKEGDEVKAGDVLAELEDADLLAAAAAAEARVAVAQARAAASRASADELTHQIEREKALVERGAVGRAALEDLLARARSLEKAARASEAEVRSAKAEAARQRVLLQDRIIAAPIDGVVITKPPEVGALVGPGAPLVEIVDFRSLVVETDVPEARLQKLRVGSPCEIVLDAYPSDRRRGTLISIGKRVNRAKASVPVTVELDTDEEGVLPEMAARVSFLAEEISAEAMKEPPKKVVPAAAVVERAGEKVVFVVDRGVARRVPVTLAAPIGDGFEIVSDLSPGTRVVARPPKDLRDGQQVKEKEGLD